VSSATVTFGSGMVWSVGPKFPEVYVAGRGWTDPSLLEPGDVVSRDKVVSVVRRCSQCGLLLGGTPGCGECSVAAVMSS